MPRVKNMMIYIKTLGGAVKKSTFTLYHDFARMSMKEKSEKVNRQASVETCRFLAMGYKKRYFRHFCVWIRTLTAFSEIVSLRSS